MDSVRRSTLWEVWGCIPHIADFGMFKSPQRRKGRKGNLLKINLPKKLPEYVGKKGQKHVFAFLESQRTLRLCGGKQLYCRFRIVDWGI